MENTTALPHITMENTTAARPSAASLGILGGGQLARMMLHAASALGLDVAIMEPAPDSPAGRLTRHEIVGAWNDEAALRRLAAAASAITLENEFVPAPSLQLLERLGAIVTPGHAALAAVQDKLLQKTRLADAGLPVPPFRAVEDEADVLAAARDLGWPLLLKRRRNGYDGYGNRTLRGPDDVAPAMAALRGTARVESTGAAEPGAHSQPAGASSAGSTGGGSPGTGSPVAEAPDRREPDRREPDRADDERALMVEGYVSFARELAVMVVRGRDGELRHYPVVETIQRDHICHRVLAPAALEPALAARAVELACAAVRALDLYGVAGVELFLAADGALAVNELAPRVHNSGHYTIEACVTSQFENAVRAALGLPLGDTALVAPAAAMVNLLGAPAAPERVQGLDAALAVSGAHVHLYGKRQSRPGRKMGHVTALGANVQEAAATAQRAAACLLM